jgi:hypothetical protein
MTSVGEKAGEKHGLAPRVAKSLRYGIDSWFRGQRLREENRGGTGDRGKWLYWLAFV